MYHIGICDDDEAFCWQTEAYINTYCKQFCIQVETQIFTSGQKLLEYIDVEKPFDILLLDIEMDELNGISIGQILLEKAITDSTQIVYVSAISGYSMQLFQVRPMDFLIKPITMHDISHVIQTYCKYYDNTIHFFEYKSGKSIYKVNQKHIILLQSNGKSINVVTVNGQNSFYGKLSNCLEQLNPETFFSTHKSYVINWNHIAEYRTNNILLSNGFVVPISPSKRDLVKERIMLYCERNKPF